MVIKRGVLLPIILALFVNINAVEKVKLKATMQQGKQRAIEQQKALDKLRNLKDKFKQSLDNKEIIVTDKDINLFEKNWENAKKYIEENNIYSAHLVINGTNNYYQYLVGIGRCRDLVLEESWERFVNDSNRVLQQLAFGVADVVLAVANDPKEAAKSAAKGAAKSATRTSFVGGCLYAPIAGVGVLGMTGLCLTASYFPFEGSDKPWNKVKDIFYDFNQGEIDLAKNIYNGEFRELGQAIGGYVLSKGIIKGSRLANSKVITPINYNISNFVKLPKSWKLPLEYFSTRNQKNQRVIPFEKLYKVVNKKSKQKILETHKGKPFKRMGGKEAAVEAYGNSSIKNIDEAFLYDPDKNQFGTLALHSEGVVGGAVSDGNFFTKTTRYAGPKPQNKANIPYIKSNKSLYMKSRVSAKKILQHLKGERCYDSKCNNVPLCADKIQTKKGTKIISKPTSTPDAIQILKTRDAKVLVSILEDGGLAYRGSQGGIPGSESLFKSVKKALSFEHIVDVDLNFGDGIDIIHFVKLLGSNLTSKELSRINFVAPKKLIDKLKIGHLTSAPENFQAFLMAASVQNAISKNSNLNQSIPQESNQTNYTNQPNVEAIRHNHSSTTTQSKVQRREIDLESKVNIDQKSRELQSIIIELSAPETKASDIFNRQDMLNKYSFSGQSSLQSNRNNTSQDNPRGLYQNFKANFDVEIRPNTLGSLFAFYSLWRDVSLKAYIEEYQDKDIKRQINENSKQKKLYDFCKVKVVKSILDLLKTDNYLKGAHDSYLNGIKVLELNNINLLGADQRHFDELLGYINSCYFDSKGNFNINKNGYYVNLPYPTKLSDKIKDFIKKISWDHNEYCKYLDMAQDTYRFDNKYIQNEKFKSFEAYERGYFEHFTTTTSRWAWQIWGETKAFIGLSKEQAAFKEVILNNSNNKKLINLIESLDIKSSYELADKLENIREDLIKSDFIDTYRKMALNIWENHKSNRIKNGTKIPIEYKVDPLIYSLSNRQMNNINTIKKLEKRYNYAVNIAQALGLKIDHNTNNLIYSIYDDFESKGISNCSVANVLESALRILEQDSIGRHNFAFNQILNSQGIFKGFNFVEKNFSQLKNVKNLDLIANKRKVILLNKFLIKLTNSNISNSRICLGINKVIDSLVNNNQQKFEEAFKIFSLIK